MTTTPRRIAVITASVRQGRFGPTIAAWFLSKARQYPGVDIAAIDLADVDIASPDLGERIDAADGVVVITPEYNHSFPGPLKTAIDSLYGQWQGKPVAFVSYGGISGGLRAVEALRVVFAELHATTARETVSFAMARDQFDESGAARDPGSVAAVGRLMDQLTWWADVLREGRRRRPYGQKA